jgi:LysM repeat protein
VTGTLPNQTLVLLRIAIILILAGAIFGGAYLAVHELYIKPDLALKADKEAPRPLPPVDPSLSDFQHCVSIRQTGTPQEAVAALERFLVVHPGSSKRDEARDIIGELNSGIFFGVTPQDANTVIVKSGDSLGRVAARAKMSVELIVHLNKLQSDRLHPGQKLIAFPTNFRLVLKQKQQQVALMNGDKFFRQYPTLSWPGKKPLVPLPKQTVRVVEKAAITAQGTAPKPASQEYFPCFHTVGFPIAGHSLFSQSDDAVRAMPGGIRIAPAHMSEIAVLLPKGAQVTLE